jgi:hypothetical protein
MAGCKPFNIAVSGDIAAMLERATSESIASKVNFEGDTRSGTFSGKSSFLGAVEGEYEINGDEVTIKITSKPFLISCKVLESKIREYFEQAKVDGTFSP